MITPRQAADQLVAAERERKQIAPFTDAHPSFDVDAAYEAQRLFVQSKLNAGQTLAGAKLGLTSRAKQQRMGIATPLTAWLTDAMVLGACEPVPGTG